MAYIRVKKAKRKSGKECEYAYIVETKRVRRIKVKQKSKKYLGRVHRFDRNSVMDFFEHYEINDVEKYLAERERDAIIFDLIKLELFNHGFEKEGKIWEKEQCYFDEKSKKVVNHKGNPIALAFNEGFLTTHALRKLLNFNADDEEDGYVFAKMFVEAGIAIPPEVFVGIFRKAMK